MPTNSAVYTSSSQISSFKQQQQSADHQATLLPPTPPADDDTNPVLPGKMCSVQVEELPKVHVHVHGLSTTHCKAWSPSPSPRPLTLPLLNLPDRLCNVSRYHAYGRRQVLFWGCLLLVCYMIWHILVPTASSGGLGACSPRTFWNSRPSESDPEVRLGPG